MGTRPGVSWLLPVAPDPNTKPSQCVSPPALTPHGCDSLSEKCRVHLMQTWIKPDASGHTPAYGSKEFSESDRKNKLLQILGGTRGAPSWGQQTPADVPKMHQNANVFVSESDAGHKITISLPSDRQVYLLCIEGSAKIGTAAEELELKVRGNVVVAARRCWWKGDERKAQMVEGRQENVSKSASQHDACMAAGAGCRRDPGRSQGDGAD